METWHQFFCLKSSVEKCLLKYNVNATRTVTKNVDLGSI